MYFTKFNISFAFAFPLFTTKPACFVDTSALPILYPFKPHSSINFAVIKSVPLLNVLPADGYSSG